MLASVIRDRLRARLERGRQEALLCQYAMKIPANPFPFARTRRGESRDSGSSSTIVLASRVGDPTGQDNGMDVLRTCGAAEELDWAEASWSTPCKVSLRRQLTLSG